MEEEINTILALAVIPGHIRDKKFTTITVTRENGEQINIPLSIFKHKNMEEAKQYITNSINDFSQALKKEEK